MRVIDEKTLKDIEDKHQKWLNNEEGGERANLHGAYLTGAYLTGANLTDAYLTDANLTHAYLTRAYLTGANLTYANLTGANLTGADLTFVAAGNQSHIITIQSTKYRIAYTSQIMAIGCKQYLISEWMEFDDRVIKLMDDGALDWWKVHKPLIMGWIKANPAEPTKEEDSSNEADHEQVN